MTGKTKYGVNTRTVYPWTRLAPSTSQKMSTRMVTESRRERLEVSKKEKNTRMKALRSHDYKRLKSMVPAIADNPNVSKLTVIEETVRYIDHLHSTLLSRLKARGIPHCFQDTNIDVNQMGQAEIRQLVCHLITKPNCGGETMEPPLLEPPHLATYIERCRTLPSYLLRSGNKRP
ncbi:uncharacterized protein LOC143248559 isoform X2 [Tachypleus tridentatus]